MAKEMASSQDPWHLKLGGALQFNKPPLSIWFTAFFYKLLGVNEFSSRLFASLAGLGTVLTTYFFGRQLLNRWMGLLSALVLASTSHFILYSRMSIPDIPFTFFFTLSLYFFWRGFYRNRFFIFSGLSVGLSVLAVGFQAFFIFPLIWLYLFVSGHTEIFSRSTYWIGVMLAALVALPWHLYQMVVFKDLLWRSVDWHFFTSFRVWLGGEFFYYVRVLVNKDHPWVLFALFSAPYFLFKSLKDRDEESIFLTVWIFFTLIFLSFLREKRFEYLAPLYPALSITVSYWLGKLFKDHSVMWVRIIFLIIMVLHVRYSHIFDNDGCRPVKELSQSLQTKSGSNEPVYLYRYDEVPAAIYYFSRPAKRLDQAKDFEVQAQQKPFSCILSESDLTQLGGPRMLQRNQLAVLASSGGIFMIGSKQ